MKFLRTLCSVILAAVPVVCQTVCRIVSLSGGGSHGAFEAGVLANLMEKPDWKPWDVHLGVSAGSLGVLGLLKDDYKDNMNDIKNLWFTTKTSNIIEPFKSPNSLSGNDKIRTLFETAYNKLQGSVAGGDFYVGVTDLVTGSFVPLKIDKQSPDITYFLASTGIPIVFPPSQIKLGNEVLMAVDGGLQKNEFFLSSLEYCNEDSEHYIMDLIFANFEIEDQDTGPWSLWNIASRSLDIITNDFNNMFSKSVTSCGEGLLRNLGLQVNVHIPPSPISVGVLDFDHGPELWSLGYKNVTSYTIYC
jgi:hypothetical protein